MLHKRYALLCRIETTPNSPRICDAEMDPRDGSRRARGTLSSVEEMGGLVLSGRYELSSLIGSGGMGDVWEARHLKLGKVVAVKLLRGLAGGPTAHARLLREARVLATLRHEALVEVFDFGETNSGAPYFVMERVTGGSLADAIERRGALAPSEVVAMGIALADGLSLAHAAGVIHRDVKPDNVLLAVDGTGKLRPKLVDFGVAYVARESAARLTAADGLVGTPEYMAPEAIRGVESGERVDVWGLALTLYEAVTGVSPFRASDPIRSFRRVLDEELPRAVGSDATLDAILAAALHKDHASRTRSVAELARALRAWLASRREPVESPPHSTIARPNEPRPKVAGPRAESHADEDAPVSLDALIRDKLRG